MFSSASDSLLPAVVLDHVIRALLTQKALSTFFVHFAFRARDISYGPSAGCRTDWLTQPQIDEDEMSGDQRCHAGSSSFANGPELFDADWTAQNLRNVTCELTSLPGKAIAPKSQIAMALRQVGYTRNPVAIKTTQSASQLHLKGCPCQELVGRIKIHVDNEEPRFSSDGILYSLVLVQRLSPQVLEKW